MIIDNVPDALVAELQDIYWDPSDDIVKPELVKETIVKHLTKEQAVVRKEDLASWLQVIKEGRKFKEEAEHDIGWVAETFYKIEQVVSGNPMKILAKVLSGGDKKLKELGLDPENLKRLQEISAKYAPLTVARLKSLSTTKS